MGRGLIVLMWLGLLSAPVQAAIILPVEQPVVIDLEPEDRLNRAEASAMLLASLLFTIMVWRGGRARNGRD